MNKIHDWLDNYTAAYWAWLARYLEWARGRSITEEEHQVLVFGPWVVLAIASGFIPWWAKVVICAAIVTPFLYTIAKALIPRL